MKLSNIKKIGAFGLVSVICGNLLGSLTSSAKILLLGRIFEGLGLLVMGVTAPVFISIWFSQSERSLPMGIWATWVPVGSVLMFNLAQPLSTLGTWRTTWWFSLTITFIALLLYIWVVKIPSTATSTSKERKEEQFKLSIFKNKNLWLLALLLTTNNSILTSYSSWAPLYLNNKLGISSIAASFYASLIFVGTIPSNILAGWVIQKIKSYRKVYTIGFVLLICLLPFAFHLQKQTAPLYMLLVGLVSGFIPTAIFSAAPIICNNKKYIGLANSTIIWGLNLGLLVGPAISGKLYSIGGWTTAGYFFTGMACLGLTIGQFIKIR